MKTAPVSVSRRTIVLPTYHPLPPDKNPMFLENRVYQGSSGKVYPLPFYDRVEESARECEWEAVFLENEFVEVMLLPQIGGRIHAARDKTNGYDFFYRQDVIKPALVGLSGPWISGGVEFNWPQHHRPATYMPVDTHIERGADGSVTVWCSSHDPLQRMKGMHGVCLHPAQSLVEVKVRVFNRTPVTQTFLWWANVATEVHEGYQSFFPPDVDYVADHARRSMSAYPLCEGSYYGVNYGGRAREGVPLEEVPTRYQPSACGGKSPVNYPPNDLSFYANIPVPTSYMCMGSTQDFFGGYDHFRKAGVVHVANHHISPGKKQWTWGNHEFGYAWDRNLTDPDSQGNFRPYIEIMAGVYTDNQPDFAFLLPGETKSWSHYWYPIREIGPVHHANREASLHLRLEGDLLVAGVAVSRRFPQARLWIKCRGRVLKKITRDLGPACPLVETWSRLPRKLALHEVQMILTEADGREVISWAPVSRERQPVPAAATEPPLPEQVVSNDELFLTGVHLDQYRHATLCPASYWREALRRDPGDARCNTAMGIWHFKRGEFGTAESYLQGGISRLTFRNANPADGEAHYYLGLVLRHLGRAEASYAALYKSVWNQEWQAAGYYALAQIDCEFHRWELALDHLGRSLLMNAEHLGARNLRVMVLQRLGRLQEASDLLQATRLLDPLDWWSRHLQGESLTCDTQTALDLVHDLVASGFFPEAGILLRGLKPDAGTGPLVLYTLGWVEEKAGRNKAAKTARTQAAGANPDYCFPARLEEIAVLESARLADPRDARAAFYLGNLFYDRRRHREAMSLWETSTKSGECDSVVWRNLGIGYQNIFRRPSRARSAFEKAFRANPSDGRLLYERDQLWKRTGERPERRLCELETHRFLVDQRDDLSVEMCALYNQTGAPEKAREILLRRKFQPWEGGEGLALAQFVRTCLALGRQELAAGDATGAINFLREALHSPQNLSEAKHLFGNQSDVHYWLGCALAAAGESDEAKKHWLASATFQGDFQGMTRQPFSETTYYSALSWKMLGEKAQGRKLLGDLLQYARSLQKAVARMDYFATSLPLLLIFEDDLQSRQEVGALFLQAQAHFGLGRRARALALLKTVLARDPNHASASDFLKDLR